MPQEHCGNSPLLGSAGGSSQHSPPHLILPTTLSSAMNASHHINYHGGPASHLTATVTMLLCLKVPQELNVPRIEVVIPSLQLLSPHAPCTQAPSRCSSISDKLGFNIKSFCTSKNITKKVERQSTKREKIFANHISDKGPVCKIYKELL